MKHHSMKNEHRLLACRPGVPGLVLLFSLALPAISSAGLDPALLAGMKARAIGPAGMSGRVAAVAAVPSDPNVIYVGAATGGVWKSTDGGLAFTPIFDREGFHAIGALAIHPQNPSVVWVGTGEGNTRNSAGHGGGIYRSLDAGRTWQRMGLERTERIHRIVLHPSDPNVVYATALGSMWKDNDERGVYRSRDGGRSWEKILYVDEKTGASDLVMDPENPNKLLASTWQYRRWPWLFKSGGPGSGLWRSSDGGDTWTRLTTADGLPKGELGRIGLAIAPSDPNRVYALVEAEQSAMLASTDGGYTFAAVNTEPNISERPFYYSDIYVDPEWPDRVYRLATVAQVSDDGGKTFQPWVIWDKIHPDHHTLWVDPHDGRHLLIGNDGGVGESRDRGATWRHMRTLPVAQFYHVRTDNDLPYHVYGGLQDNGSWRGPSEVWENGGIRNAHWQEVAFGDGFDTSPDPEDSQTGYAMSQGGNLVRWNMHTGEQLAIRPPEVDPEEELRFNWNAGFAPDPFDPATIYYGSQFVHRSTDRGASWEVISPDLTSDNPEWQKQKESGGLTPDVTAAENYTTIITIAPSPHERGVLWVGTDDGRVHLTRDGGAQWTRLDRKARGVPEGSWVPHITVSPHDPGTAFVVFDDHRRGNFATYAFRVDDYGARWTSLVHGDIAGQALIVQQDVADPALLFLGTELGLYYSTDSGGSWAKFTHGVPTASVMDLAIQPRENDLVLGTHGRGILIIDDISPLRRIAALDPATPLELFDPPSAQQYSVKQSLGARFPGATEFRGENAPYGALITFYLGAADLPHPDPETEKQRQAKQPAAGGKDGEKQESGSSPADKNKVTLEIRRADGGLVRKLEVDVRQGINRTSWDLSREPLISPVPPPAFFGIRGGPEVPPGEYRLTARFRDQQKQAVINVKPDPRVPEFDSAAQQAREAAIERISVAQADLTAAIRRLGDFKTALEALKVRAGLDITRRKERDPLLDIDDDDPHQALIKRIDDALKALSEVNNALWTPPMSKGITDRNTPLQQLQTQAWQVGGALAAPSPAQLAHVERAQRAAREAIDKADGFINEQQPGFEQAAGDLGYGLFPALPASE